MSGEQLAAKLMIGQSVLFAAETVVVHQIGTDAPVMELAFIRAAAGVALALMLAWRSGLDILRTRQLLLQLVRGGVAAAYLWVMMYSFSHLPFADATAISYTQAAYIALFSVLILGETVCLSRWAAAAIGIAGALLIAKPNFSGWSGAYLIAFIGASLNGLSFVLNKYLQRQDSDAATMFYTNLVPALAYAPALAFVPLPVSAATPWLLALMTLGPLGVYAGIVAVKHASAAMLGPYTLLRLVLGVAGGVILFHELPDVSSALGVAIIIGSCALSSGLVSLKLQPHLKAKFPRGGVAA
jgi:drug/metabolite transporter (DMT)-like permease